MNINSYAKAVHKANTALKVELHETGFLVFYYDVHVTIPFLHQLSLTIDTI